MRSRLRYRMRGRSSGFFRRFGFAPQIQELTGRDDQDALAPTGGEVPEIAGHKTSRATGWPNGQERLIVRVRQAIGQRMGHDQDTVGLDHERRRIGSME